MVVADEARAEDDVGAAVEDGLDEPRILGGVVFPVGILNDDDVAGAVLEAGAQGGALARVLRLLQDADVVEFAFEPGQDRRRAVGRAVVDQD